MTQKSKMPEIRFKGFSGEWEEKELDKLSKSFEYGLNVSATDYDGKNKYIRITDINEDTHLFDKDNLTSPTITLKLLDNYKLEVGDILFARTGASVGKTYIYKEKDGLVYYAGFLIRARIKEDVNTEFIFQNTLTNKYNKFVKLTSQRSGQPGINAQEYSSYSITLPLKAEQTKIGTYFHNLDKLITQHQQKHEKLLNVKKAMLEKMFPKEGEDVPKIRFEGFRGDWEEKELKNLTKINQGLQIAISSRYTEQVDGSFFYITNEFLKENSDTKYYILNPPENVLCTEDDILMTRTGNTGEVVTNISGAFHNNFFKIKFNDKELNKNFFIYYLRLFKTQIIIAKLAGTSTIPDLNHNDFYRIKITFSTLEEQTKIGNFFKKLDKLITLQQTQLEKLKNIKKASLEKMFV